MIAEELGVAPSSVSRALNNRPGVSLELQNRVQKYARSVGYVYDNAAKRASLKIVGMIIGDIRNPFYAELVFHTQNELTAHGYQLCIFNSEYTEAKEIEFLQLSERFNFAGAILMNITSERINNVLQSMTVPIVMINRNIASFEGDTVLLDNFEAGYIATRHLISLGHSRIGFILGQPESSSTTQRYLGYQQAMKNYNLSVNPQHILQGDLTLETGLRLANDFAAISDRPSAMVVSNDLAAHGFMSGCMNLGIRVPEQLSVVSFDNISISSIGSTTLSSIDPSTREMAQTTARLMIQRIEHPEKAAERIVIKPVLIERKSSGPYRRDA